MTTTYTPGTLVDHYENPSFAGAWGHEIGSILHAMSPRSKKLYSSSPTMILLAILLFLNATGARPKLAIVCTIRVFSNCSIAMKNTQMNIWWWSILKGKRYALYSKNMLPIQCQWPRRSASRCKFVMRWNIAMHMASFIAILSLRTLWYRRMAISKSLILASLCPARDAGGATTAIRRRIGPCRRQQGRLLAGGCPSQSCRGPPSRSCPRPRRRRPWCRRRRCRGPPCCGQPGCGPSESGPSAYTNPVTWATAVAVFGAYAAISLFRVIKLNPSSWDLGIYTEYVKRVTPVSARRSWTSERGLQPAR